jgi:hypothetical protein
VGRRFVEDECVSERRRKDAPQKYETFLQEPAEGAEVPILVKRDVVGLPLWECGEISEKLETIDL